MGAITTIVHFSMPAQNVERFFAFWQETIRPVVERQPGLLDGVFHRYVDADGPFQFINVARWESAELLAEALRSTAEEIRGNGVEMLDVFSELGVTVSQNNYLEAVRYRAEDVRDL
ncbi:antibiotic biosynthesis monooxygenase [Umezawaea endophytica]|uniref:Antibiotic biosynthesis monooxygenase n=1 Tax=Umezawaea endophytica TaxID=1654476 RepID=A0A9X2VWV4_9PSEU|nr:antibiotic biosynthesis monooxygenase [Umezawaea endophytica]MCS7483158.1 antibiotic biosynthesis monooxygenase [Umezawaea endophytica]